jgi:hypothetical protein
MRSVEVHPPAKQVTALFRELAGMDNEWFK